MWIVRGLESYPPDSRPSVVALGAFDGVHLAHQAILATAVGRARDLGLPAVACTFDPHPMDVLQPGRAPSPITTMDERLDLIRASGVDGTIIVPFTKDTAAIEPEAFVKDILLARLGAREIVVGFNHTFGRAARGNAALLESLAPRLGFTSHVVPPLTVDGEPVSSSIIRAALQRGDVEYAARLLGRPYAIAGEVVQGAGRGRTLGFPTANVQSDKPVLIATGVYVCRTELDGRGRNAVVNVGVRPTFGEQSLAIEAYVLDFSGDLYGRRMRLSFVRRLRGEMKFPSVDALREQIARDVETARGSGA